ncbi:SDR family oxidoreductase [Mumia sp. ZJ430]|uniref:SDR family oxidoreductase n=1 Tax=Mumia sp. ZJ430 TaxID=2708083 RepID=UPI00141EF3FA|nr:SDR family oxidoreductase [Mumia sp. ZJ430]
MTSTFTGRVAVVTGAARGIGAGVAREYVRRGGRVALIGLEPDELKSLAAELGDAAAWWEADVRDTNAVTTAVNAAATHFGRIDDVLANAGIASYGTVRQIDPEAFERVVDVNLNGVFRTLRATIPHVIETKGYLLVVSSLAAFTPLAGLAPYNASKAGVEALALATRQEMWVQGVKVGVCHPSWIDTDIVRGAEADLPSFKAIRSKLPWPANGTTTLEDCVTAICHGIAKKKRRVYVPRGVVVANLTKPLVSSALAEPIARRMVKKTVSAMEAEVAALGRNHSGHVPVTDKA